ncbi:hypothetical protein NQ317_014178 [Molorchus minor]|uniref:Uncharacterized protein n=1 Tax=Molorchus minor TaxID=1323400 RepID=A0ABQ9JIT1_9CUCU|nr:hypothetical protein NQ317_014178 [Molorchus minor]
MENQLKELQHENKQLLNMIQKAEEPCMSRTASCSTISMVNLQYKYEELLANYNGLLKILEMRISDIRKYQGENAKLKQEIESMKTNLQGCEEEINNLVEKLEKLKYKKDGKVSNLGCPIKSGHLPNKLKFERHESFKLREERETLALVHNHAWKRIAYYIIQIKKSSDPDKALLLQEIRKNNILTYENFQQQQEIAYLQSLLKLKRCKSNETISSESKNSNK